MYLKIADFIIKISGKIYPEFYDRFKNYIIENANSFNLEINLSEDDNIPIPDKKMAGPYKRWYHLLNDDGSACTMRQDEILKKGIVRIDLNKEGNKADIKIWNREKDYPQEKAYFAAFFTIGEAFSYSLLKNKMAVLHSSSIIIDGNAIAFSAKSGTGKSTHTKMWKDNFDDCIILNDDTPVIRFNNDIPYLFGSPFAGTSGINQNTSAPLKAIVFLQQADENKIEKLSGIKAISYFLDEIKKPIVPDFLDLCLELTEHLLKTVPVYLLSCTPEFEAVELVKNTIGI
ncbi:MAG: hypothetical protein E7404_02840 [Ruminococcaceae bacterium]|nr:hypothetical protein [Oscillospiraceae bacterium]